MSKWDRKVVSLKMLLFIMSMSLVNCFIFYEIGYEKGWVAGIQLK